MSLSLLKDLLSSSPETPSFTLYPSTDALTASQLQPLYLGLFVTLLVIYALRRLLHLEEMGVPPTVHVGAKSPTMDSVLERCPSLRSSYKPTWLWGKSGHIQTLLFGMMHSTRKTPPATNPLRHLLTLSDGSVISYNVYEPLSPHKDGREITLICAPGIFGDYNKSYIQSLFGAAVRLGYRCVCLNHLGVPKDIPLSTPRLFTYGSTEEFAAVCDDVFERFPESQYVAIGFSMGANVVCKYLGEEPSRQAKFIGAMSVCQGYDVFKAASEMGQWHKLFYTYVLLQRWIDLVEAHPVMVDTAEQRGIQWRRVKASCRHLGDFDRHFTTPFYGYSSFEEFCNAQSSAPFLSAIRIPMVMVNSRDDPLIGPSYNHIPIKAAEENEHCVFVETQHGGHLGYFDRGVFLPKDVWIDTFILDYVDSLVNVIL